MDGLPKNKRPLPNKNERPNIALDDYLFERKLQEVYDKKEASDDLPRFIKNFVRLRARLVKKDKPQVAKVKKKKVTSFIDAPQKVKKRFAKKRIETQESTSQKASILPKISRLRFGISSRTKIITGALVAVLIVVIFTTIMDKKQTKKQTGEVAGASTEVAKPTFTPLASGNEVRQKVKFDTTREVASYEDKIGGVRVVVSQQKLVEKDRVDPNFLSRTATAFNLKTDMTTKKGQAYSGVNIEKNTQFTMFVYKDFLVFIQGDESVKNQLIVDYIDSLE